jgi:hypothetical protein
MNNSYSMSIDLKVIESPENGTSIFWGHQFTFMNGEKGYIGFGLGGDVKVATIAIFDANGGVTTNPNGGCQNGVPFSLVGFGYQCFVTFDWKVGSNYALQVTQLTSDQNGNEQWEGTIHDYLSDRDTIIGSIIVSPDYGMLGSDSSTWNEYSIALTCATPDTSVIFSSPVAYNSAGNHPPAMAQVLYGNTTCQNSDVRYLGGGAYKTDAGQSVSRTTPKQTWLWTEEPTLIPQDSESGDTTTQTSSSSSQATSASTSETSTSLEPTSETASSSMVVQTTSSPITTVTGQLVVQAGSVPGYPWESIIMGMALGMVALALTKRRRHSIEADARECQIVSDGIGPLIWREYAIYCDRFRQQWNLDRNYRPHDGQASELGHNYLRDSERSAHGKYEYG